MKIGPLVIALSTYDGLKMRERGIAEVRARLDADLAKLTPEQREVFDRHVSGEVDAIAQYTQGRMSRRDGL